ncbi:MAG: histidine--tRNA ligase [Planctomycetota bacterium]|nr:histidine--tRNA ligase [Planctomycetota bacterium]
MAKTSAPSGFRDFLPDAFRKRAELIRRIREVYESFGFEGMDTPAMENLHVFLGKGGGENEKLMFLTLKRGEDLSGTFRALMQTAQEANQRGEHTQIYLKTLGDMGLRFDLTVPLARFYNTHRAMLPAVFKRYQIGPVWRAERAQHGRFREFIQCDVDVLGSSSMQVEAEVVLATSTALARLGFSGLTVRLNSRPLLNLLVRSFGFAEEHVAAAFVGLDKLDKAAPEEVKKELLEKGAPEAAIDAMLGFCAAAKSMAAGDLLDEVSRRTAEHGARHTAQLREVLALTPPLPSGKLVFDPFLARGMDYYTGPIFEVAAEGVPFSLAGGGRFDGLVDKISGKDPAPLPDGRPGGVPACGFSIGFERVFTLMEERGMFGAASRAADVLIAVPSGEAAREALQLGAELRENGLRVDVYPAAGKPVPQFELAQKKGIPYAIVADPAKAEAGVFEVRDLATRQNDSVKRADLPAWLKGKLGL